MTLPTAKETWSAVAGGWDESFEWYARNIQPLTQWFCDSVATPGARVLDIACGTGQPALAIAERVLPGGRVVSIDLAPGMIDVVKRRALGAGLHNVEAREMDAEELRIDDQCFDAVTCACGLMFCPDPARAVSEMRRVLVPGGRFAIAVWNDASTNPFFTIAARSLGAVLPPQPTFPGGPGPFRLGASGELERVLLAGGFSDFTVHRLPMTFEMESAADYWRVFTRLAAGIAEKVALLPEEDCERARELMRAGSADFTTGGRLRIPATALCAVGQAPRR